MLTIHFKKNVLPHLLVITVFLLVTLVFFAPAIFHSKVLPQHDVVQGVSGSRSLTKYRLDTGAEGLWSNAMFAGMPGYLLDVRFSGELTRYVHHAFGLYLPHPFSLVFISFFTCYLMLLSFGVRPWLAIAGGLAFGLTEFSIIGLSAGHNSKVAAVAFMPLVLAGIQWAFSGKRWLGFAVTALGLALELRANHLQITYYLLLIILVFGLSQLIIAVRSHQLIAFAKTVSLLCLAAVLGVGANIGKLWSVMEYSQYSTRGKQELVDDSTAKSGLDKAYAFQYSNGIAEPLVLFIPNFFGGSSRQDLGKDSHLAKALQRNGANRQQIAQQVKYAPAYWGDQPLTAPYYAGAIVVFLFVLGLCVLPNDKKVWLIVLVVMSVVLSWGSSFGLNDWLFDYLPGYNKFRSVTFVIIITVLALIIGGFSGLEYFVANADNHAIRKKLWFAIVLAGGVACVAILLADLGSYRGAVDAQLQQTGYPDWFITALRADRVVLLRIDALRTLVFIVLFASAIWLLIQRKISTTVAYSLMVVLVLVDMFGVSKRFINSDSFKRKSSINPFVLTVADSLILKDKDPNYKVLNLVNPFNDAKTSYHHQSIGGYHGAKMGRYQDLIERCLSSEQGHVIDALQQGSFHFGKTEVINMLNTKYFLAGATANAVVPNPNANGNAWFVSTIRKVNTPNEEIEVLSTIDTKSTAVVDQSKFAVQDHITGEVGEIALTSYKPNEVQYTSSNKSAGLAVFSEIYYAKGWEAMIDNQPADILRVNYVLRALEVPAGDHRIVFRFAPKAYTVGNVLTWCFNVLLLLAFVVAMVLSLKSKNQQVSV